MLETIGTSLINTVINYAAFDPVALYDQNFQQIFSNARPVKVLVKPDSQMMNQPLESGATTIDHRILLPREIELSLVVRGKDYQDTYQEIKNVFESAELIILQTKVGVFDNLLISSMPHEEDAALFDAITLALKLKEVQFATTQITFAPRDVKKSSTKNRGNQQTKAANDEETEKAGSWAGAWAREKKLFE